MPFRMSLIDKYQRKFAYGTVNYIQKREGVPFKTPTTNYQISPRLLQVSRDRGIIKWRKDRID